MTEKTAVLMMAYGGPDSLDDIEPYLLDVRGGRATSPELIEEIRERYALIGGKSPLLEITCRQARALENALNAVEPGGYQVFVGMRHWHPYIRQAVAEIAAAGITRVITICMTPFASRMSTGAYAAQFQQAVEAVDPDSPWRKVLAVRETGAWYANRMFVRVLADNVQAGLQRLGGESPMVAFTAHSLPAALADQGDPYDKHFQELARLVANAAGLAESRWLTCYQSAGAQNTRWLGPSLEEEIHRLAGEGETALLVAPIGFLADHVEVLYDIDIEAQHEAKEAGIRLARTDSVNDQPEFIAALAEIVKGS